MGKSRNRYCNPNPKKRETSDCVVRALCKVTGREWGEVYKELCDIGYELKVMPNDPDAWKEYLIKNNFEYHKISNKRGSRRPTVDSFAKEHKEGTHILRVAGHIVACVEGYHYDVWDSGRKSLYGYWEKKGEV